MSGALPEARTRAGRSASWRWGLAERAPASAHEGLGCCGKSPSVAFQAGRPGGSHRASSRVKRHAIRQYLSVPAVVPERAAQSFSRELSTAVAPRSVGSRCGVPGRPVSGGTGSSSPQSSCLLSVGYPYTRSDRIRPDSTAELGGEQWQLGFPKAVLLLSAISRRFARAVEARPRLLQRSSRRIAQRSMPPRRASPCPRLGELLGRRMLVGIAK